MKISVVLTTYNGATYLPEQLNSISSQTCSPSEVVISDDNSSDRTRQILREFQETACFDVRILHDGIRRGPNLNFARAIAASRGDIIAISDQDDRWHPDKLQLQCAALTTTAGAVGSMCNARVVGKDLTPKGQTLWQNTGFTSAEQCDFGAGRQLSVLLRKNVVTGAATIFRGNLRELVAELPEGALYDAWLGIILATRGKIALVDRPLYDYRQHGDNVVGARPTGPLTELKRSRSTGASAYRREQQWQLAAAGILATQKHDSFRWTADQLRQRAYHLEQRARVSEGSAGVSSVVSELRNGGYHRFSRGSKSAANDLFRVCARRWNGVP